MVECDFRNGNLELTLYPLKQGLNINILYKVKSDKVEKYENEKMIFLIYDDSAVMKVWNTGEENFVAAYKYTGELPDKDGELHYNERYFSDAVKIIYIIKQGRSIKKGNCIY